MAKPRTLPAFVRSFSALSSAKNTQMVRRFLNSQTWIKTSVELHGEYAKAYHALGKVAIDELKQDRYGRVDLGKEQLDLGLGEGDPRADTAPFTVVGSKKVFETISGDAAPGSYASANYLNQWLKGLFPELRKNFHLGHKNISVLKVMLAQHPAITGDYPKIDNAALVLLGVIKDIDQMQKPFPGFSITEMSEAVVDALNTDKNYKIELVKEIGDIRDAKFELIYSMEDAELNMLKGRIAAAAMREFNAYQARRSEEFAKIIDSLTNPLNLKSSPDLLTDYERMFTRALAPKGALVNGKFPKPIKGRKTVSKVATGVIKGPGIKKAKLQKELRSKPETKFGDLGPMGPRRAGKNTNVTTAQLGALLSAQINGAVADNMGLPRLQYQTGRFAGSVQVSLSDMKQKGPNAGKRIISYRYMDLYKTFEKGGGGYQPFRDPRELITESIREVAVRIVGGKFDEQFAIRKMGNRP